MKVPCQIRGLNNLEFSIEIENVGTAIQAEKHYHKSRQALGLGKITFDQYLRHAEINAYLAQLAKDYPDTVTLETIGQSYEKHSPFSFRLQSDLFLQHLLFHDSLYRL
nr:PREDICTED: uncharacterized protein LOC107399030 [Tribolium castaneum]XP_015840158.1 PREDICTED: uncharacterized protein LOC107399031 [Tribolium castaneum]|eukprot:XP_015840157.1 PREDICTED: uncharacterized protein LOC107399030 [Tribolium castaneum]